jgi:hypothetical protein
MKAIYCIYTVQGWQACKDCNVSRMSDVEVVRLYRYSLYVSKFIPSMSIAFLSILCAPSLLPQLAKQTLVVPGFHSFSG